MQTVFRVLERPNVDRITGLSPVVVLNKKQQTKSRSTVGTVTEIYDFVRLLFAKISDAYSPLQEKMVKYTEDQYDLIITFC